MREELQYAINGFAEAIKSPEEPDGPYDETLQEVIWEMTEKEFWDEDTLRAMAAIVADVSCGESNLHNGDMNISHWISVAMQASYILAIGHIRDWMAEKENKVSRRIRDKFEQDF